MSLYNFNKITDLYYKNYIFLLIRFINQFTFITDVFFSYM